jgi:soluble P-type ATPase
MTPEFDQSDSHQISVNTAEQDDCIQSVTVFQTDRAEVKRRVIVELKVRWCIACCGHTNDKLVVLNSCSKDKTISISSDSRHA